jgi:hypothetical protein
MQRITNGQGRTIGYIGTGSTGSDGEQRVMDANQRTVGYINDHGTYDLNRCRISTSQQPGLLLR